MDLGKADPRTVASLIFNGRRELDEVPKFRRPEVVSCIETLKAEAAAKVKAEAAVKAAAKKPKPKAAKGTEDDKK